MPTIDSSDELQERAGSSKPHGRRSTEACPSRTRRLSAERSDMNSIKFSVHPDGRPPIGEAATLADAITLIESKLPPRPRSRLYYIIDLLVDGEEVACAFITVNPRATVSWMIEAEPKHWPLLLGPHVPPPAKTVARRQRASHTETEEERRRILFLVPNTTASDERPPTPRPVGNPPWHEP
jgi:hypothetical protein